MGVRIAYKTKELTAQGAERLIAGASVRLLAFGAGDTMPPLPADYKFVVDYQGKYVLDYQEKYVIAKV